MGVDLHGLRLLSEAQKKGVSFASTIMIGRQNYYEVDASDLARALNIPREEAAHMLKQKFVEPLLKKLGAERIESVDNSTYEQATIIHDMNTAVPEHLKGAFSCVFDGGSLEHIFNFPQAIRNCMEMVAVGGHFLEVTAANNFMGHGFYQFGPELYYRVFSPENGFAIEEVILCEVDRGGTWYRAEDPESFGRRVELINSRPTYILVVARKINEGNIFQTTPQQSDYVAAWDHKEVPASSGGAKAWARSFAAQHMPRSVKRMLRRMMPWESDAFRRI
jgi:hypothetical protein